MKQERLLLESLLHSLSDHIKERRNRIPGTEHEEWVSSTYIHYGNKTSPGPRDLFGKRLGGLGLELSTQAPGPIPWPSALRGVHLIPNWVQNKYEKQ